MTDTVADSFGDGMGRDADHTTTTQLGEGEDRQIAYAEYGDPDGTPVVFLHGTPGSRRLAELFDGAARDHGVRLLSFDRPGYGQSSPWPTRAVNDAGKFVGAVLDEAGVERAHLLAFSGGGPHALAVAATHSERVREIDVVAGATPPELGETPLPQRLLEGLATTTPTLLRGAFRGQAWLAARLNPGFVTAQYTSDTDGTIPATTAELVKRDFVEAFARSRRGAVTEFRITADDWEIPFEDIDAEIRFWHGTDDANVPISGVRELTERLPNARLREVRDADHLHTLLRSVPKAFELAPTREHPAD